MKALRLKLLRDLLNQKGLFTAVAVVILLGVSMFDAPFMAFQNLKGSYDYTYEQQHFADLWLKVTRAPLGTDTMLARIPGVTAAIERVNADIPLTLPATGSSLISRVISLPAEGRSPVNDVKVTSGSYFSAEGGRELLVEQSFADYHKLKPGDKLSLQFNGSSIDFTVAGVVVSPEYIFPAKSQQELFVSADEFGVLFIRQPVLASLTGNSDVNEFCLRVSPGTNIDSVITTTESNLAQYTVVDVTTRANQPSGSGLNLDLQGFKQIAEVFPLLFLVVGILTTYILLTRLIQRQRSQIGLMRALGYSRIAILSHYLEFAVIVGIAGGLAGSIAGYFMGQGITVAYVNQLHLPYTSLHFQWATLLEGFVIGFIPCVIAGVIPANAASRLSPAEAMHSPPPTGGHKLILEQIFPGLGRASMLWKIPLRNIFRSRRRSLSIIAGVAFGTALVLAAFSFIDSINGWINFQFDKVQLYDASISFADFETQNVTSDVAKWPQTSSVEPVVQLPVRIESGGKSISTLLFGIEPSNLLVGLYTAAGERVSVTGDGVLLALPLKNLLGLQKGDSVTLITPAGNLETRVAGFVKQPMGSAAYVSLGTTQQILGGQNLINAIMLKSSLNATELRSQAAKIGPVSLQITQEFKTKIVGLIGLFNVIAYIMLLFGTVMALMVVFTVITVGLVERSREIATMRTLGEKGSRINAMVSIENMSLGLTGLILGIPLGYVVAYSLLSLINGEMFTFDVVILPASYFIVAAVIISVVWLSQLPGIRNINRLKLAKVTKEQVS